MQLNSNPGTPTKCSSGWVTAAPLPHEWVKTSKRYPSRLVPITMENQPAREVLLESIFCRYAKGCVIGRFGCRKTMRICSAACLHCQGKRLNGVTVADEDDEDDVEPIQEEPGPLNSKKKKMI